MAETRKNIDQIDVELTTLDGTERNAGRNDTGDFKITWTNIKAWLKTYFDTLYAPALPVGAQYTQYPTVQSNTISTALPSTEAPAALFGGTWAEIKIGGVGSDEEEAIFYRTGGKHLEAAETTNRTTGKQDDRSQGHIHGIKMYSGQANGSGYYVALANYAAANYYQCNNATDVTSQIPIDTPSVSGTNGTPRTGKENYPVNRIFKTWEKTSLT